MVSSDVRISVGNSYMIPMVNRDPGAQVAQAQYESPEQHYPT